MRLLIPLLFLCFAASVQAQADLALNQEPETDETPIEKWDDGQLGEFDTPLGEFHIGGYATFMHKTLDRYNGGQSVNFFDAIRIVPSSNGRSWTGSASAWKSSLKAAAQTPGS